MQILPTRRSLAVAATPTPASKAPAQPATDAAAASALALRERLQAPDFDAARVADIRAALARGEIGFDADKLAGLIQQFHGRGR